MENNIIISATKPNKFLAEYRTKKLGLTQVELAENLLNVSRSTVQNWERGNNLPRPFYVEQIFHGDPANKARYYYLLDGRSISPKTIETQYVSVRITRMDNYHLVSLSSALFFSKAEFVRKIVLCLGTIILDSKLREIFVNISKNTNDELFTSICNKQTYYRIDDVPENIKSTLNIGFSPQELTILDDVCRCLGLPGRASVIRLFVAWLRNVASLPNLTTYKKELQTYMLRCDKENCCNEKFFSQMYRIHAKTCRNFLDIIDAIIDELKENC